MQGRLRGIRYRYPKFFSIKTNSYYWGPVRRGFHVQKCAAIEITNMFLFIHVRFLFLRKRDAAITIQNKLARAFLAQEVLRLADGSGRAAYHALKPDAACK